VKPEDLLFAAINPELNFNCPPTGPSWCCFLHKVANVILKQKTRRPLLAGASSPNTARGGINC
jgi:hypothetical protein